MNGVPTPFRLPRGKPKAKAPTCACRMERDSLGTAESTVTVIWCPIHASATRMLALLKAIAQGKQAVSALLWKELQAFVDELNQ
jgi:hypothetical protein